MATSLSQPIRVVLVDDHAVVRTGLRMLIESRPGTIVVGEAGNSSEALAVVARTQPDIIVLDLDLGGESGLDCVPELRAVASTARESGISRGHGSASLSSRAWSLHHWPSRSCCSSQSELSRSMCP